MSTHFTFLRHGQTQGNAERRFIGGGDPPLNETGIAQAEQVAELLRGRHFEVLLYGRLKRVEQTAMIVLERLEQKPEVVRREDAIRELRFGDFEGKTFEQLEREYPAEIKNFMEDWAGFCYPGGDCVADFYARCAAFVQDASLKYNGKNILIVGHKAFILACAAALLEGDMSRMFDRDVETGGFLECRV